MALLEVEGLSKSYGPTLAVSDISFAVGAGRVLAVCGENGAGKSTLMNMLSGARRPSGGEIRINGTAVSFRTPQDAFDQGIRTVYQELSLLPHVSVAENILMGRLPERAWGIVDWAEAERLSGRILRDLGFPEIDPCALVRTLSVARQQIVEIAKALVSDPRILILDEPTAVLSGSETAKLFTTMKQLTALGTTILYISHRLEEIFEVADEVVVIKDGRSVLSGATSELDQGKLIHAMVGRPLTDIFPPRDRNIAGVRLSVEGLGAAGLFDDVSFDVHSGEILGFFGLVGSGRTEIMRAIFGAQPVQRGKMVLNGAPCAPATPAQAVAAGIAMITEERKNDGLALEVSILDNASQASMSQFSRFGVILQSARRNAVTAQTKALNVRPAGIDRNVGALSGGNQQKVVLAKWLLAEGRLVYIFDEPTRGVDVGTKVEIYQMIDSLARGGAAVVVVSSEMPEVIGLSNRMIVMRDGIIAATLMPEDFTPETIFSYAAGITPTAKRDMQ
jgi:ABC-type sugar transport system ATPase subunit